MSVEMGDTTPIDFVVENEGRQLRVIDSTESRQIAFTTERREGFSVRTVGYDWFAPVDHVASLGVSSLRLPETWDILLRDPDGELLADVPAGTDAASTGHVVAEVTTTPIKLYVAGSGGVRVSTVDGRSRIQSVDGSPLVMGARSLHERPARTLTVPPTVEGLMQGVSEFGAALKTTSPERTFPTLRGYPPELQFGAEPEIPQGRQRPETGVCLGLPRKLEAVLAAAPLAYFLGAEVTPADETRLELAGHGTVPLAPFGATDAESLHALLVHAFVLECAVRTEGLYPVELAARERLEATDIGLNYAELYDEPLADRLAAYLTVPTEPVAAVAPEWRLTADVPATIDSGRLLPHLADELANIRPYPEGEQPATEATFETEGSLTDGINDAMETFLRDTGPSRPARNGETAGDRRPSRSCQTADRDDGFRVRPAESILQVYAGDGIPIGANKVTAESYRRQLADTPENPAAIRAMVICNDPEMTAETDVRDIYASVPMLRVTGELHTDTTVAELRRLLREDVDLLHYVGHVSERGIECSDGHLDVDDVEHVSTRLFILNGCRSFGQAEQLIEKGALGGVGTLRNVDNETATKMGKTIARLLQNGWSLGSAVSLLQLDTAAGLDYAVLGDGTAEIASADSGSPFHYVVGTTLDGGYQLSVNTYPTRTYTVGSMLRPAFGQDDTHYLAGGEIVRLTVDESELREIFRRQNSPVQLRREQSGPGFSIRWSQDLAEDMSPLTDPL